MSTSTKPFEINNRLVAGIAIPMTLAYLSTPLLGLVDTAVVGRFGSASLIGGLAIGAILIDLLFTTFNFLRAGTTGLASQAYGANDRSEAQAILIRALAIAVSSGVVMIFLSPVILSIGLWLMAPAFEVAAATSTYFYVRLFSAPFALGNYVILGWVIGLGRSSLGLSLQLLLNGINIALSFALGLGLGWGILGVALATVIGEVLTFGIGCFFCYRMSDKAERPKRAAIFHRPALVRLMNLNGDIMLRSFILIFAFAYFTAQGSRFGENTLAANAILMHFFLVGGYFLDGMATAAEQLAGRTTGAKYREGFIKSLKLTTFWNVVLAFALSAILYLAGDWIIATLTTNEEVRTEAAQYLLWAALTPIVGAIAFQMDGIFIGATWSREMSTMMVLSLIAYLLTWWLVKDEYGNDGLWFALHVFLAVRGITLSLRVAPKLRETFGPRP